MSTTTKFKLGRDSLSFLMVKYPQNDAPFKRYSMDAKTRNSPEHGMSRLERVFLQGKVFEWAVMYKNDGDTLLHYYHPKRNTQRLSKEEFYDALGKASLKIYIIYTAAYKRSTGKTKGLSLSIDALEDVHQYWNGNVERILLYKNGKQTHYYTKGQFFEK